MGKINFLGKPPFEPLFVREPKVKPTPDGVELIVTLDLQPLQGGGEGEAVSLRLVLEPTDAAKLCPNLASQAAQVLRWRESGYDGS